jgi:hypothetical protein
MRTWKIHKLLAKKTGCLKVLFQQEMDWPVGVNAWERLDIKRWHLTWLHNHFGHEAKDLWELEMWELSFSPLEYDWSGILVGAWRHNNGTLAVLKKLIKTNFKIIVWWNRVDNFLLLNDWNLQNAGHAYMLTTLK